MMHGKPKHKKDCRFRNAKKTDANGLIIEFI